jgi:hypothetical protein
MEPESLFCLAALVFLALPLPVFASVALQACPAARRPLLPWVWSNAIASSANGLLIIATGLPRMALLATGCVVFLICGMRMFQQLARIAAVANAK